jgi:hypothetical protein
MSNKFTNMNIDDECCRDKDESVDARSDDDPFQNQINGMDIVQLKNNIILKGLVSMENIFNENDVARNPKIIANDEDFEDCNIETQENPKIIKLSKMLSLEVR